jgi:hypothetical protein
MRSDDALKYAAAILRQRTDWTLDGIGGSMCDGNHETDLDATREIVDEIADLAAEFGDPRRYSDGRVVKSEKEIQLGLVTSHVWHPDPAVEGSHSWRSNLPSDPGVPSPGIYEVTTYPVTQEIHVRVVRSA